MGLFHFKTFHNQEGSKLHTIESVVLAGLIFTIATSAVKNAVATGAEIKNDTLRLHIIANSDSEFDQELKLKVRDKVLEYTGELFAEVSGKTEAEELAKHSSDEIKKIAQEVIAENGADYAVSVEITDMWFETRTYDEFTLPAGDYRAVRIIIGAGEGHNWWCVMYPPLCIPGAKEVLKKYGSNVKFISGDGFEIRFAILELLERLKQTIN